ncbi:MAG: hypothetical protein L4877_05440 [Aigarchaeota archaeon]|nr:hypothetical protein [Candidatus Geocrenenecus dongiae]
MSKQFAYLIMVLLEGYYVMVRGNIFAVKGVLHPDWGVIAIPTYIRSSGGYRRIRSYRESITYLQTNYPEYLVKLDFTGQVTPVVPLEDVENVYNPLEFHESSTEAGVDACTLKNMIESMVDVDVGVSGSILLKLDDKDSDIDLVVYGLEAGERFYEALRELRIKGTLKAVNSFNWISETRSDSKLSVTDWMKIEVRKILTGIYKDRLYTAKIVPSIDEYWEDISQKVSEIGRARIICSIVSSRFGKTTPNMYKVKTLKILEGDLEESMVLSIMSMRSRFSEIAGEGEEVEVEGRLEKIIKPDCREEYRIFLGNDERDKIIPRR